MTTETALAPVQDKRELALLKAIGFDRLAPEQRELALNISTRYGLDPLLKHIVMIEGRAYITRDGLLHVAHDSGQLDGIVLESGPEIVEDFWRATVSVYRKDMSHPFRYAGRYPTKGGNQRYAPEMAVKVAEVMALRRAFDVAAPAAEERWDVEATVAEPAPRPSLAERVAEKAAAVETAPDAADPDEAVWEAAIESVKAEPGMTVAEFNTARKDAFIPTDRIKDAGERLFPGQRLSDLSDRDRLALWLEVQG